LYFYSYCICIVFFNSYFKYFYWYFSTVCWIRIRITLNLAFIEDLFSLCELLPDGTHATYRVARHSKEWENGQPVERKTSIHINERVAGA